MLVVLAICIPLGVVAGNALFRMLHKTSGAGNSGAQSVQEYTCYCPHCGEKTIKYADRAPTEWICYECKCHYFSNGQISQETLAEYRIIDQWSGLNTFINLVVDETRKTGFITLKDGGAYLVSPDNPRMADSSWQTKDVFVASYPTDGISIVGELHLMQLCLNRCRALNSARVKEYWLMDRGLAWKRKGN